MPRQLRNKGGITNAVPREKYGLGSKLKERFRKLIPNELADVAVAAAPFVAPFNPGIAGLMRGIGRFDQRGSISDALKQGFATTAFGAGARALGGATDIMGGGLKGGFTSPLSPDKTTAVRTKAGNIFDRRESKQLSDVEKAEQGFNISKEGIVETLKTGAKNVLQDLPKGLKGQLIAGGLSAGASLLASYFQGEFREQEPGETIDEYLAARKENVGKKMRVYMDNYFKTDPEYSALDDAGKDAFVARYNLQGGGRVNYSDGTKPSADETVTQQMVDQRQMAMVEDMLKKGMDISTIKSITGASDEMIQDRINFIKYGGAKVPVKKANGGMPTGIMRTNKAGVMERDYRDKGGFVPVGIKEKADDVPAMLSKNEFVFTADAVRGAGGGSIEKGAQRMYNTMKNLEKRVV